MTMQHKALGSVLLASALMLGSLLGAASAVASQSMTVVGGNSMARTCYNHANFVATVPTSFATSRMIEVCTLALEHAPLRPRDRAATHSNRGILHALRGELQAALDDYEQALRYRPDAAQIYINRGNIYHRAGFFEQAIADYSRAMELDQETAYTHIAYMVRGLAYERRSMLAEAEADYRRALELRPGWTEVQTLLSRLTERRAAPQDA